MRQRVLLMVIGLSLFGFPTQPALMAKEWARAMFENRDHDFQTVARGTQAVYDFVLQNKYVEDIHIAEVRSSCGCTSSFCGFLEW